ncbi:triose-phosphate isomerase family protein [Peribacillus sp. SCS-155]|uniref:triose-phosphate isomerase family protein n=1 Tax=Peribacillus sedimenti TaxID=3115297 RepID=UPI0039062337
MRQPVVGLSLKNYINSIQQTIELFQELNRHTGEETIVEQILFPSLGTIYPIAQMAQGTVFSIGAQNIGPYKEGPFTGEMSIISVMEMGGNYIEIGHAERKRIFHESQQMINEKIKLTLEMGLSPLVCIGEEEIIRDNNEVTGILREQIKEYFEGARIDLLSQAIIAYEPIWAIGKPSAAEPRYVHGIHRIIRQIVAALYGKQIADHMRLIYGGSVSKHNTRQIVDNENVDGVFLGRFGHDPHNYKEIVGIVREVKGL